MVYRAQDPMSQETKHSEKAQILNPRSPNFAEQWQTLMCQPVVPVEKDLLSEQKAELRNLRKFKYWQRSIHEDFEHDEGVWCYFPWHRQIVRVVSKEYFLLLRLARNIPKTDIHELLLLREKRIGIVGMSVGQSILRCLAQEGVGGHFAIADFDYLETTNLNRIASGLHQSGLKKTTIASRFIAELDPFIEVSIYPEGINETNIEEFVRNKDLIIEECDNLSIKKLVRNCCKAAKIPVLMDTSDQLMIDVERYDLEPNRPIFHGLIIDTKSDVPEIIRILEPDKCSERGRKSLTEIGVTIPSWPQLASDVQLGSAVTAKVARAILLGETIPSGRFRCDIMSLFEKQLEHR
jgi:molybdopterin/thiamine biosynthesis adenylyltransferase